MSIFHCSVKPVQRSAGRSATAAAAYRAGCVIECEREGRTHDYSRKGGIIESGIVGTDMTRAELWNAAEAAERRKDGTPAREFEVALPTELTRQQQLDLCRDLAASLTKDGGAADWSMHDTGDGNPHVHILRTTRHIDGDTLGAKLNTEQAGRRRRDDLEQVRSMVADRINSHLARAGHEVRVDHRSHADRGIDAEPTKHMGPVVADMARKGKASEVLDRIGEQRADRDPAPAPEQIHDAEIERDALAELREAADQIKREREAEKQREREAAWLIQQEQARLAREAAQREAARQEREAAQQERSRSRSYGMER